MNEASVNLQERNSQFSRNRPERSAKLMLHPSNAAFVSTDRREIALVKVDWWKLAPRKLEPSALIS